MLRGLLGGAKRRADLLPRRAHASALSDLLVEFLRQRVPKRPKGRHGVQLPRHKPEVLAQTVMDRDAEPAHDLLVGPVAGDVLAAHLRKPLQSISRLAIAPVRAGPVRST